MKHLAGVYLRGHANAGSSYRGSDTGSGSNDGTDVGGGDMGEITLKDYEQLLDDRPRKFTADEVNYREAEGKERCFGCTHFYVRRVDRHTVCEIFRSPEVDDDGVDPDFVCDFFSPDGNRHPLY